MQREWGGCMYRSLPCTAPGEDQTNNHGIIRGTGCVAPLDVWYMYMYITETIIRGTDYVAPLDVWYMYMYITETSRY